MLNKKIVMCGNHEAGLSLVSHLIQYGIRLDYFILLSKEDAKTHNVSGYIDYEPLAKLHNIPVYYVKSFSMKDKMDVQFFKENKFDLLLQGGWQRLFPVEILNTFSVGCIGVHGSSDFLPKGRGRSPLNWSLIENKKRFIMQYFLMKSGADDGDVFASVQFDINEFDDIKTLYYKNTMVTKKILLEYIPRLLKGDVSFEKQHGDATYYPKRTIEDGQIKWAKDDIDSIERLIRASTKPYPGAFSYLNEEKMIIWEGQILDRNIKYENAGYGEIVEIFDEAIIINCLGGLYLIGEYEVEGVLKVGDCFD